ncbi:MAG TPA: PKD domain-containing protein [Candidatus Limnocylindrales bacterium]|nr:PKD domain-containing protein [Candidatus Limnocylindrales bacterium]
MAPRVFGAPLRAAALAFGIALSLVFPLRSNAQYMYLDANGDGIHTAADVVAASGSTAIDVWLITNRNRDGSQAVCSSQDGDLTINSYEVILHAANGSVTWGAIANQIPEFTIDYGTVASGTEAHVAFLSGTILPAGTYRLASVSVSVGSGTPAIQIAPSTVLSPVYGTTFGSQCSGLDFDNTLKLGSDWFDADGLPYGGVANLPPTLDPVGDMAVDEGSVAEQEIRAVDPEGGSITFTKVSGPSYMSVTTISGGPGIATGRIRLEPDYLAAGTATGIVGASDGSVSADASFAITVTNVPRAPLLAPVSNMTDAVDGVTTVQRIAADDPDNEAQLIHFSIASGPPWVTVFTDVAIGLHRIEGEIHVDAPSSAQSGDYPITLLATKQTVADSAMFTVTVTGGGGGDSAPFITGMPDVSIAVGHTLLQQFYVYDFDGDAITLEKASGPAYMTVTNLGQSGTQTTGLVTLTPGPSDVGGAIGVIRASDGILSGAAQFSIVVYDLDAPGATLFSMTGDLGDYISRGQTYLYQPPAVFTARADISTHAVTLSISQPPAGDYWYLAFSPPDSGRLMPGFYANAIRAPFNGNVPGLSISGQGRGCNTLTGLFEIKRLEVGPDGALISFWARFEQHCEGAVPGLTGEVRINPHTDLVVTAPLSRRAMVGDEVTFQVTATSASGGAVSLAALGLPEGADFLNQGNGTGTLTWRPTSPLAPTQVVFEARDLAGHVDRSTALLTAGEGTSASLRIFSDPGDPVGGGVDRTYSGNEIVPVHYDFDPYAILFNVYPTDLSSPLYLYFRAADPFQRILPGSYEGSTGQRYHAPGTPTFEISSSQTCGDFVSGRFEVKEVTYDSQGHVATFHAYFTQQCGYMAQASVTGEIRLNAHPAIDVSVPLSRTVREGESAVLTATALPPKPVYYTIQGLPTGATFTNIESDSSSARLTWTPDFTQAGVYTSRLLASRPDGASFSLPLRLNVLDANRPPTANAGGPYEGIVGQPIAFDGTKSSDPDGDALYYHWTFGDSTYADSDGPTPFHTYPAAGQYRVILEVRDASFNFSNYDFDTTSASIHGQFAARMFVSRGNRDLRLASGKPAWCVQVEPVRSAFAVADVDLSSLALVSDSTSGPISRISALAGKTSIGTDTDGNGIEEVTACFAKHDLQQLFAYVSGRSVERVSVVGRLTNGSLFRATMQIEVFGNSGKAALTATPNPLNPETVLTYYLPQGSTVRLRIFEVTGRLVATLMDGPAPPGYGSVRWGPSSGGGRIASGVYYASLETNTERRTIRLVVLK